MKPPRELSLPTGCDLSLSSLRYALIFGEENGYMEPEALIVGPENWFIARELLALPLSDAERKSGKYLRLEKSWHVPQGEWWLEFGNGRVTSHGIP